MGLPRRWHQAKPSQHRRAILSAGCSRGRRAPECRAAGSAPALGHDVSSTGGSLPVLQQGGCICADLRQLHSWAASQSSKTAECKGTQPLLPSAKQINSHKTRLCKSTPRMNAAAVAHKPERSRGARLCCLTAAFPTRLPGLWLMPEPGSVWFLLWGSSLVLVAWLRCTGVTHMAGMPAASSTNT